jgi:hypothetical protein
MSRVAFEAIHLALDIGFHGGYSSLQNDQVVITPRTVTGLETESVADTGSPRGKGPSRARTQTRDPATVLFLALPLTLKRSSGTDADADADADADCCSLTWPSLRRILPTVLSQLDCVSMGVSRRAGLRVDPLNLIRVMPAEEVGVAHTCRSSFAGPDPRHPEERHVSLP